MSDLAISLQGVTKRYGQREALRQVDLAVPAGSIFAVLGPNGAGKTTLIRSLMGLMHLDEGTGSVLGYPLGPNYPPRSLKERIGYVAQQPALYERMTAGELLDLARGLHPRWDGQTVRRYLDLFSIPRDLRVRQMSTGTRAQLALTLVMGGNPELLILDEPTLGLDPLHRHQYLQLLLADSVEAGRTVLLSSHDLHQIERLADRVTILVEGKLTLTGAIDDLKVTEKRIRIAGDPTEADLLAVPGVRRAVKEQIGWLVTASGRADELRASLLQVGGVKAVQVYDQSLEEIFLSYVG